MEGLGWWFQQERHGLYERALQATETVTIGWLLYSTREMDLVSLKAAIEAVDPQLEVGLRWRLISLGKQGAIPADQQVRAIHIEVDKSKLYILKPILFGIYDHRSSGPFPNDVKMRIVPDLTLQMSPLSRAKADRLRNRQANFTKYSVKATTWEIATLDFVDASLGASLRQMIMSIVSTTREGIFLFHSIDPHWQGNGYIVTFLPDLEEEARMILAGLIPFLVFRFPDHSDGIKAMFTPEAVQRAAEAHWDPTTGSVITAEDGIFTGLEEIDMEYCLQGTDIVVEGGPNGEPTETTAAQRPDPSNLQRPTFLTDQDSVSTIHTQGTSKTRGRPRSSAHQPESTQRKSRSPSNSTQHTSVSSVTIEDKVGALQTQVFEVANSLKAFIAHFEHSHQRQMAPAVPSADPSHQDHMDEHPLVTSGSAGGAPKGRATGPRS
jgi:hypothetical protein